MSCNRCKHHKDLHDHYEGCIVCGCDVRPRPPNHGYL